MRGARRSGSRCSFGRFRSRTSNGTRNLVLAAEFIPQSRVADLHDVVLTAARDPCIFSRAASELEGTAELFRLRVLQDVLGKNLGSIGLCEGLVAAAGSASIVRSTT